MVQEAYLDLTTIFERACSPKDKPGLLAISMVVAGSLFFSGCGPYRRAQYNRGFNQMSRVLDEKKGSAFWEGVFSALNLQLAQWKLEAATKRLNESLENLRSGKYRTSVGEMLFIEQGKADVLEMQKISDQALKRTNRDLEPEIRELLHGAAK